MIEGENKKTILIIEDSPLNMRLTVDLLELAGFNTLQFSDGESALEALPNTHADLILVDISLPKMDGFGVHKRIRQNRRFDQIKVVALSALAMKEDQEKVILEGFDAFISKPIDTKDFIKKIKELLA